MSSSFLSCQTAPIHPPAGLQPAPISLTWRVVSHLETPDAFSSELTLNNTGETPLGNDGWTLFFNFIRMIDAASVPATVQITHINGDFFKLEPTEAFPTLETGEEIILPFLSSFWAVKESDAPTGFYMVYTDDAGQTSMPYPVADYSVGSFSTPAQTMRSASDEVPVPTPASRYAENADLNLLDPMTLPPVVPSPATWQYGNGLITIDATVDIHYSAQVEREAAFLHTSLSSLLGEAPSLAVSDEGGPGVISLSIGNVPDGDHGTAYTLSISPDQGIAIIGADPAGVFYGIQTLRGLIPPAAYSAPQKSISIPVIEIEDYPRFAYRGMHLDVARNFHPKASILRVLDVMAFYKLNKFHFHLTDDEGWRLEIEGLPELTEVGSRRGHTLDESTHLYPSLGSGPDPAHSNGSGHYSRTDFIEILRYATERHIEVIPEIDVPGHARAAIKAMEARFARLSSSGDQGADAFRLVHPEDKSSYRSVQMWNDNVIDVCLPSTYAFLEKVIDDLQAMYAAAGAPLNTVHTGNDEVPHGAWTGSPACNSLPAGSYNDYFLEQLDEMLTAKGLNLAGWEEIALKEQERNGATVKVPNPAFINRAFRPYVWNAVWGWGAEGTAYTLANAGYKIVLSNATNLYFDFAYDKSPEEPGFYWAGFSNTEKAFTFNPYDLYQNASMSLFGQPIDAETAYRTYPRLTDAGQRNVLGVQGQLWSENAKGKALLEYQLLPKLLGLAERAWSQAPAATTIRDATMRNTAVRRAWNVFANQLGQTELARLDGLHTGYGYRVPPPGAIVEAGLLKANVVFPGLEIRYTTEDRPPSVQDPLFVEPIPFEKQTHLRAFSSNGRASRTTTIGAKPLTE